MAMLPVVLASIVQVGKIETPSLNLPFLVLVFVPDDTPALPRVFFGEGAGFRLCGRSMYHFW